MKRFELRFLSSVDELRSSIIIDIYISNPAYVLDELYHDNEQIHKQTGWMTKEERI